ncbi:MAG: Holliday junction branch migration DNA helicase RuvB, partial [Ktedonobacterales bacterium]
MADQRIVSPGANDEDHQEVGLRPRRLEEYIGQEKVKDNLRILLDAAKLRSEALDHVLLY